MATREADAIGRAALFLLHKEEKKKKGAPISATRQLHGIAGVIPRLNNWLRWRTDVVAISWNRAPRCGTRVSGLVARIAELVRSNRAIEKSTCSLSTTRWLRVAE